MTRNRTMPDASVIPLLVYDDVAEAIEWLCRVFGFRERWRAGTHRAQLEFDGGGALILSEAYTGATGEPMAGVRFAPAPKEPINHQVVVQVTDADLHFEKARDCGAEILAAPRDFPYGERQYSARDLGGHHWTFSQSVADVAPEDWGGATPRAQ
jgi:uncharacterized glyoxalase superfamily protein PhnB